MGEFLKLSLEENYQLLDNIISLMPGHVYWKDKDGFFLGCNEEQAKAAGLNSRQEIIGKTDFELPWKEQANILRSSDLKVMKTGKPIVFEEPSVLANGTKAIFLSKKVPLRNKNGEIIGILGISADITELKKVEKALQEATEKLDKSNRVKAKFLRVLQHNLRNKLTGILSFSELLLDFLDDKEKLKAGLKLIYQTGLSIIPTLDKINHYSSIDTGQLKPYYTPFELNPILKSFKGKYQSVLSAKGLEMEFELDAKLENRLIGDSLLIYDVVDQLIANAIKYTTQGKITVETYIVKKQGDNIWLDIVVKDTGCGIPRKLADHLFKLFDSDSKEESRKYTNPSINLSICKRIAELLKGDLVVDSQTNKGTDFTFSLKLKTAKSVQKRPSLKPPIIDLTLEEENIEPVFNKRKFSVLIIEDDLTNQEALQALLSTYFHCKILYALDLKTAKQLISENPSIDLILTDIQLPDGEGQEIMPYLYKLHPSNETIPCVVAITAFAREVDIDYFCDQGILGVISKPITLKELTDVIKRLFGNKVIKKVHQS